jgi:hypothetical protein
MHPKEKPFGSALEQLNYDKIMKKRQKEESNRKQKTAAGNLEQVMSDFPEIKEMVNIRFGEDYLPDPFNKDPNQASRKISKKSPALKKIEHSYTKDVKKQISNTKAQGMEKVRNSAMMTFQNTGKNKYDFAADAWLAERQNEYVNYTTG